MCAALNHLQVEVQAKPHALAFVAERKERTADAL